MIRRFSLVVLAAALLVSACGRQVTPDRNGGSGPGGLGAGLMQVKFRTQNPMDFTNVAYVIAFNTSGTGTTPYALYGNQQNLYKDFWYEWVVAGGQAVLYQFERSQNGGVVNVITRQVSVSATDYTFVPNSNGIGTEFTLTFKRSVFLFGATGTPPPIATTWYWNFFTVQVPTGGQVQTYATTIDACSHVTSGTNDTSFVGAGAPFDITTSFDLTDTCVTQPGLNTAAAVISGSEFINAP